VTIADALSEQELGALRGITGNAGRLTPATLVEHLRSLLAASQAALLERDEAGHPLACIAASPPIEPPYDWLQRLLDHESDGHTATISLSGNSGRDTSLVFLRDDRPFTEADRLTLALLRPHLETSYRGEAERHCAARPLTPRQREVLRLVAYGYRNDEIAHRLVLSAGTVRKHLNNIYQQLGVSGRAAAVARVFAAGLTN
jgi:DNA-binding CsgD family transcriptional regulator